jgi:hypothetical protein
MALKSDEGRGPVMRGWVMRSNADKREAVLKAWRIRKEIGLGHSPSARAVAVTTGVSAQFSRKVLREAFKDFREAKKLTGLDGRRHPSRRRCV